MDNIQEIWKDVVGYEGLYQVSDKGKVRSISKRLIRHKELSHMRDGYVGVILFKLNKPKHKKVHRLVAEAFIDNIDNKPVVNHKNGNKTDNSLTNLEWLTHSENMVHSYRFLNRNNRTLNHKGNKLQRSDILSIRSSNAPTTELANKYKVHINTINRIKSGKAWRSVA